MVFHDEFEGTTLDLNKWIPYNPVWDNVRGEYFVAPPTDNPTAALAMVKADDKRSYYSPNNIAVGNGSCKITFRYEPQNLYGGEATFSTGKLFHKLPFESGRFDIRCRMPRVGGVWVAFWMMGFNPCTHPFPGGGEIDCFEYNPCATGLNRVTTSMYGYKRFGCDGPQGGTTKIYRQEAIDDWHIYSTEWDRNFVRIYVDGILKAEQTRYANGNSLTDCFPGRDERNNGHWVERTDVFPFYAREHNQSLMAELKCTRDLYTVNFLGICTPSMRSHYYIDRHLEPRVWEIDYIRVYQRQSNIQNNLKDLGPAE
jgi:hypothetical protein